MRRQRTPVDPVAPPAGLAFAIGDLLLMKEWADLHDVAMTVQIDHGIEDEEYEEVVAFRTGQNAACFLLIWRSAEVVVIQPLVGRPRRYRSVSHVLDSIVLNSRPRDGEHPEGNSHLRSAFPVHARQLVGPDRAPT